MVKEQKKILIVEDSKNYLWVISQNLIQEGFNVITAENGADGLALAKKENPDLILADIVMPVMDGLTMAKSLKEANIETPIIFLTNMSDLKHITDAAEIAAGYIVKSDLNVTEIINRVKEKLR